MPFGLCNASAVFQRAMNNVLAPYLSKFCLVYIDDVVVYLKSPNMKIIWDKYFNFLWIMVWN